MPEPSGSARTTLRVRGAREHNLREVDVDLPRDRLVVLTGVSGSGKSSLAFDTVYAEGQRRYVESLSAYARQFLGQMDKPDVDLIEGLSPAISIDQKSAGANPRSTVGTITEIHDHLRLLYARVGRPHCPSCGRPIEAQSAEQICDQIERLPDGARFMVLAPVIRGRKGEYERLLERLAGEGYARAKVDGEVVDLDDPPKLARYEQHDIDVVVDRLVVKAGMRRRLVDSVETALALADGMVAVEVLPGGDDEEGRPTRQTFSEHLACPDCELSFDRLAPRDFSFNTPYGACPTCSGLGSRLEVDPELVVGGEDRPLRDVVLRGWPAGGRSRFAEALVVSLADHVGVEPDAAWRDLPKKARKAVLHGVRKPLEVAYRNRFGRQRRYETTYEGLLAQLERKHGETDSDLIRRRIEEHMREVPCPDCGGARLRPHVLAVTVGGLSIAELSARSVAEVTAFVDALELDERETLIAERIVREIRERLRFLLDVGLDYLSLDRGARTLAGGEAQRIRLATQIGSGLVGCLYVLDEPSIGLHQRDNERLIDTLERLRDLGNTVIVVEHDRATIEAADHVVDIGPGAGEHGGRIVHSGTVDGLREAEGSLTGDYLAGRRSIPLPERRREPDPDRRVVVRDAREHNLDHLDVGFPLGCMVCVTGVSGSGKSTLVNDVLHRALAREVRGARTVPGAHGGLDGAGMVDKVVAIDQAPIGRSPRSNAATYIGVFDHIRRLFAATPEARVRGYGPGRFSFNVKGGRCEPCRGEGVLTIDMQFLPDIHVPCEVCGGSRYNRETLEVTYKGHTIGEVLDLTVDAALELLGSVPAVRRHLQTLVDVGLGYLRMGQPATTLSGGEAQRVKLAAELRKRATGSTFYILDEPTTGLHFHDVRALLEVLHRLVDKGNTVVVIEHDLDVIKTADWIVDLGPDGGSGGGRVVAEGPPEQVADEGRSWTGKFLAAELGG